MGVVDTAFEDICVPASAILLASTTTGHVTLYRHDFCYNRAEIGALREEKIQLIPDLFVKSFVKLTTFLGTIEFIEPFISNSKEKCARIVDIQRKRIYLAN